MKASVPKIKTNVPVEADFIIAGVFFAARNAWELLRDAHILHDAGSFASAYGLAVFCREELGKSKIWRDQWDRRLRGETVTLDDLKLGAASNHRKKLERVGKHLLVGVFSCGEPPEPGSEERVRLTKRISEINVRARERDPEKTHIGRLRAFFVEPGGNEFHAAYGQPRHQFDQTRSRSEILEAEESYDRVRRDLTALTVSVSLPHTVLTILPEILPTALVVCSDSPEGLRPPPVICTAFTGLRISGKNNCCGGLTKLEKSVYLQMVRG